MVSRVVPTAVRDANVGFIKADRGATQYPHASRPWSLGIYGVILLVRTVPIGHPFPNVAQHIVQPESIGLFLAHVMCLAIAICAIPGDLRERRIARRRAAPACPILPFRFRWQSHLHSLAISLGFVP